MRLELIKLPDERLFELYRRVNKEKFKSQDSVSFLKEYWNCDEVLENNGYLYFCKEVKECELIETNIIENGKDTTEVTTKN